MPCLYGLFPAKEPENQWLFCRKRPATWGILCIFDNPVIQESHGAYVNGVMPLMETTIWVCVCVCVYECVCVLTMCECVCVCVLTMANWVITHVWIADIYVYTCVHLFCGLCMYIYTYEFMYMYLYTQICVLSTCICVQPLHLPWMCIYTYVYMCIYIYEQYILYT